MTRGMMYEQTQFSYIYNEVWMPILDFYIPNVNPYYYVSTKGRIWSIIINGPMSISLSDGGYPSITLSRRDHTSVRVSVHRIEMLTFCYIPGCEVLEVNHKDGVKTNNDITNLEWLTPSENLIHAYSNGLKLMGENHPMASHTEMQVRTICECLEKKYPLKKCAEIAGLEPNDTNMKYVSDIKNKVTWVNISNEYNIPKERNNQLFSSEEIHSICKLLENGYKDDEIAHKVRPDLQEDQYKNVMKSIRKRYRFKDISCNYSF